MTAEELNALADRVEGLTGPCRETDKAIYAAIGNCNHERTKYYHIEDGNDFDGGFTCLDCGNDTYGAKQAPAYTASLDAAMALVPTEMFPDIRPGTWWWMIESWPGEATAHIAYENRDTGVPEYGGKAATPALALTAAALRALATKGE